MANSFLQRDRGNAQQQKRTPTTFIGDFKARTFSYYAQLDGIVDISIVDVSDATGRNHLATMLRAGVHTRTTSTAISSLSGSDGTLAFRATSRKTV